MATTRRCLERVPEDKLDWKPHPKAWAFGDLATFLAILPSWITMTIARDSLDLSGDGAPPPPSSRAELLALFDKNVAEARDALRNAAADHLAKPWTLLKGGQAVFSLPRTAVIRSFVLNHLIHHRGQLTVYLVSERRAGSLHLRTDRRRSRRLVARRRFRHWPSLERAVVPNGSRELERSSGRA